MVKEHVITTVKNVRNFNLCEFKLVLYFNAPYANLPKGRVIEG